LGGGLALREDLLEAGQAGGGDVLHVIGVSLPAGVEDVRVGGLEVLGHDGLGAGLVGLDAVDGIEALTALSAC